MLAIYLHEHLGLTTEQATWLIGYYGFVVWFMPIVGGAAADRFGFRPTLAGAFVFLAVGNFLLGSLSAPWMAGVREVLPLFALMHLLMLIPAMGPGRREAGRGRAPRRARRRRTSAASATRSTTPS